MKRFDLDKLMSQVVTEYLMDGWILNTTSMTGHQGEEGKVDLVKGDELIRIWLSLESNYDWRDKNAWHGYTMYLRVGRWNYPASDIKNSFSTAWMKDFSVFQELRFYQISNTWYVDTLAEALVVQNLRISRYSKHQYNEKELLLEDCYRNIGGKYLKNHVGYKRIKWDDVEVWKHFSRDGHHAAYYVNYSGNTYRIQ